MQRNIIPAGDVEWARFTQFIPRFITDERNKKQKFTRQQKEGLRYERRAIEYLEKLVAEQAKPLFSLLSSPWIMFKNKDSGYRGKVRWCQPDGLLVNHDEKKIIIVEIKYQHTPEAWRQIRLLYEPVIKAIYEFENYSIRCLELSKWLDPHSAFPEQYYYEENIFDAKEHTFAVHLYKPGRIRRKK